MAKRSWDEINAHTKGGKSYCSCGHRGDGEDSQHKGTAFNGGQVNNGHGKCKEPGCPCVRFRWDHFVAEDPKHG